MTKVLYNKECSVCNFEIEHYKKYTKQNSIDIEFEDLTNTNLKSWGVDKDQAERRMHVQKDGQTYSGVDAFIEMWSEIPRYSFLAKIIRKPLIYQVSWFLYEVFALILFYKNKNQLNKIERI